MKILGIANIGDVHFYDSVANRLYKELKTNFLDILDVNRRNLHLVNIVGDLFHTKLQLGGIGAQYAARFVHEIVEILEGKPLRIIIGTRTHDYTQPKFFSFLTNKNVLIYDKPTVEQFNFFPEQSRPFSALYIPEEYPESWRDYYAAYLFDNEYMYDAIFLHGMMDFCSHSSQIIESEDNIQSSVVFPVSCLQENAKVVIAGHVHTAHVEGNFFYTGSFSRMAHGEEEPKGWRWLEYNLETTQYEVEFVENTDAPLYVTVPLSAVYKEGQDMQSSINKLQRHILKNSISNLRVKVDLELSDTVAGDLNILREHFSSSHSDFKVQIDRRSQSKVKKQEDTKPSEEQTKLQEISHSEKPIPEKIQEWVKTRHGTELDTPLVLKTIGRSAKP